MSVQETILREPSLPRFLSLAGRALPWLAGATAFAFAAGLARSFNAPDDFQQGATVQMMFLHVPSAWLITLIWGVMTVAAVVTLVWRHPLADVAAKTAAPLGAAFTFMCLVTGSLWERPIVDTVSTKIGLSGGSIRPGAARDRNGCAVPAEASSCVLLRVSL